jgi:hypothetical protein
MIRNGSCKRTILFQTGNERIHRQSEVSESFLFLRSRDAEIDVVLMRAQVPLQHQFGDRHFRIHRTAQLFVSLPLEERDIVGRGGRQGDDGRMIEMLAKCGERFPPLRSQVMGFIDHQRFALRVAQ